MAFTDMKQGQLSGHNTDIIENMQHWEVRFKCKHTHAIGN